VVGSPVKNRINVPFVLSDHRREKELPASFRLQNRSLSSMSSNPSSAPPLFMMMGNAPEFRTIASAGVELAYSGAVVKSVDSITDAAAATGDRGDVVLALLRPARGDITAAAAAVDRFGLPRWGVVVFGDVEVPDEVVCISRGDEAPSHVAHSFRLAATMQRWRRESARSRGDLAAIGTRVAHDLRSPLGGLLTTVEVLKEVIGEGAPDRMALLDSIVESSEGLTKLIRQLSVLTKASGGENPRERCNMSQPFWAAFQRIERDALACGASVTRPAIWPDVIGDPGWIETMWHALLCNSLHHGGPKPRIEVGWTRREGQNRFWLMDPGEVLPAKRATLFQPFHTLDRPNAPRGLGLPIVQRLAEIQGGTSGYEPVPTGGSCFFFTLPILEDDPVMTESRTNHAKL
jgi:signal transduction histidine kinase